MKFDWNLLLWSSPFDYRKIRKLFLSKEYWKFLFIKMFFWSSRQCFVIFCWLLLYDSKVSGIKKYYLLYKWKSSLANWKDNEKIERKRKGGNEYLYYTTYRKIAIYEWNNCCKMPEILMWDSMTSWYSRLRSFNYVQFEINKYNLRSIKLMLSKSDHHMLSGVNIFRYSKKYVNGKRLNY